MSSLGRIVLLLNQALTEMDALFKNAPLFVPGTPYAKVADHRAAERELREGEYLRLLIVLIQHMNLICPGTFVPGDLTEKVQVRADEEDGKASTEHVEKNENNAR